MMEISKKSINVVIALFINFLLVILYCIMTKEVIAKESIIIMIGINNIFIFVLYLLTFPLED